MPDIDNITPNENPSKELDRFFVQVRPGADEPELQVEATVEANVELEGRIGFLAVEVVGDAIAPDLNMKMTGRLKVTAETTDSALEAEGTIAINWPNVCPLGVGECVCPAGPGECTEPVITADLDFDDKLKLFDTDPSIFGWHTGTGSAPDEPSAVLIDSTRDFNLVRDVVGRTLLNITDGTSCMVTGIADPHTLECVMGANTLMEWNPPDPDVPGDSGDRYEVVGNPFDDPRASAHKWSI